MTRLLASVIATVLLLSTSIASVHAQSTSTQGQWSLSVSQHSNLLRLEVRTQRDPGQGDRDSVSTDVSASELGLPAGGSGQHVVLHLMREAGSFTFEGWVQNQTGGGTFTFTPDPVYLSAMRSLGYGDISADKQLVCALLDLTVAYVDSIAKAGYAHLPFDKLVAFRALGVDGASIADLASVGYKGLDSEQLITFAALHIDSAFIKRVQAHGFTSLSAEQLVRVKALNVIQ
jgi:hypothetical protein